MAMLNNQMVIPHLLINSIILSHPIAEVTTKFTKPGGMKLKGPKAKTLCGALKDSDSGSINAWCVYI